MNHFQTGVIAFCAKRNAACRGESYHFPLSCPNQHCLNQQHILKLPSERQWRYLLVPTRMLAVIPCTRIVGTQHRAGEQKRVEFKKNPGHLEQGISYFDTNQQTRIILD